MGRSVNKVTLIGTLGKDPEIRALPNGTPVASISLATDESYKDKATGQKVEQTEWHRLVIYGKLAEIAQQYLFKGSRAYFEGKLQTREWEKDGVKRYTTEIIVNDLTLMDRPQGQGAAPTQQGYAQQQHAPQPQQAYTQHAGHAPVPQHQQPAALQNAFNNDFDDDIPF